MTDEPLTSVYATFSGPIDPSSVQRIFNGVSGAIAGGVKDIHLLFQSYGGSVSDGICLFNYFRAMPIELTLYNAGNVSSAAVIAFLGAHKRKVSTYATFMVHRTQSVPQAASAERLESIAKSVVVDDERTEAILRENISLTDAQWSVHRVSDLVLTAKEAEACRLAEIGEFMPPPGTRIFNV